MIDRIALYGLLLGMIFIWIWNWALMRILLRHERQLLDQKRQPTQVFYPEEQRCATCQDGQTCMAADTGVIYPCEHYKPNWRNEHGQEH